MTFLKSIKLGQYIFRKWVRSIFVYPQKQIGKGALSYDAYWNQKRPQGETLVLSPAEEGRASIIGKFLPQSPITIGDIGSGPGVVLQWILKHRPQARGIAFDSSAVALASVRSRGIEGRIIDITDVASLSSVPNCDYFLILEVLEHVPNSEEVLATLYAKASAGVFFSVPNTGFFTYRLRLLFGKVPAQWIHMPNEHLRFWTIADMRWWLNAQGYSKYTIVPYRGIPILNRLMPNLFAEGILVFARV